jgi:hypothetical protein
MRYTLETQKIPAPERFTSALVARAGADGLHARQPLASDGLCASGGVRRGDSSNGPSATLICSGISVP